MNLVSHVIMNPAEIFIYRRVRKRTDACTKRGTLLHNAVYLVTTEAYFLYGGTVPLWMVTLQRDVLIILVQPSVAGNSQQLKESSLRSNPDQGMQQFLNIGPEPCLALTMAQLRLKMHFSQHSLINFRNLIGQECLQFELRLKAEFSLFSMIGGVTLSAYSTNFY